MKIKMLLTSQWAALAVMSGLCGVLSIMSTALATPPSIIRASVSNTGEEDNDDSYDSSISAHGRFVAFESDASNLVAGDNNGQKDVFVRDLKTGLTRRASVNSAGNEGNNSSNDSSISANNRFVAFESDASNLVAGDNNGQKDVFVHDLKTGVTQRVSVDSAGKEANGSSGGASISANGRFVVFGSDASNLVAGDTNGIGDVFVRDLKTGVTQRVSVDSAGAEANGVSFFSSFSADGRFVAFASAASNLVPGDTNGISDVFVRDLKTGVTKRVSVNSEREEASTAGDGNCAGEFYAIYSSTPSISADGRFVAFESTVCNLVEGDTNDDVYYGGWDVFVHDLKTGETKRISVDSSGEEILASTINLKYVG